MSPSPSAVAAPPTITSVNVTGSWITVAFSDPSSGSYTSYTVTLQAPSTPGLEWNFPSVPASGPLVAQMNIATLLPPFDPAQAYTVTVTGSPGGPTSSPFTVPSSTPALASVTVTPSGISITWADVYPLAGVNTYTATLWQGSAGINFPDVAAGLPMVATLTMPAGGLNPSLPYTVSITSFTNSGPAATSAALSVISAVTTCSTALSADALTLTLVAPVPPTSPAWNAFSFQLLDGDTVIASRSNVTPAPSIPWTLASPLQAGRRYSVAVAGQINGTAAGGNVSLGLFGPATPVIVGAPAIVGTPTYDGTTLTAAWTRVSDPAVTGYLVTVSGADSLTFVTGLATTFVTPAAITGADRISVAAIGAASTGPAGASAAITLPSAAPPTVLSALSDGRTLSVDWKPVATAGVIGYQVKVGAGTTFNTGLETSLTVPVTFALTSGLSVTVATLTASGAGQPSTALEIGVPTPAGTPTVTSAWWDGRTLFVNWTPVVAYGVAGYAITLKGGSTTQQFTTSGDTGLTVPAWLDPGTSWSVTVTAFNAVGASGPNSTLAVTLPTPPAAPTLNTATYDGAVLFLDWTAPAGQVLGYAITVTNGSTKLEYSTGPETTLSVPVELDFSKSWSVTVAAIGVTGAGSPSTATTVTARAITGTPEVSSIAFDGAALTINWSAVLDPTVLGYHVVVSATSDTVVDEVVSATSLVAPVALSAVQSYTVAITAQGAVAAGPASSLASVVSTAPELTSVGYAGGMITAAWTVASPPSGAIYELALFDGGSLIASTTSGTSSTGGTLQATLVPGRSYTVRSRALLGVASGPWSGAGAIITTTPTVLSTRYDGSSVAVTWSALADPAITGYLATLSEVGGGTIGTPVATGGTSAVLPASGLVQGKSYQVTVQAIGNAAVGAASTAAAVVIESVAPTSASYDGEFLTLSWAAASTSGATYLVEVWADGAVVASQTSARTTATFAAALSGGTACTATVRVLAGIASGVPGTAVSLLTATTFVQQGTTDAMTGLTTFSWAPLSGISSYLFQPYLGGLPSEPPTTVTQTTYTYPVALFRDSDFSLAVAGVSSAGGVKVTGPYGPMYYPPTIQPVIGSATFDGINASVSWGFVSGSTGYRVSVLQSGQQQPVGQIDVSPTVNSVVFAPTISDPTKTYGVIVQSKIGNDVGPPSAQAPLFSPGFYVSTSPATTYAPFVYPATTLALVSSSTLGKSGATATIYLPPLSSGAPISVPPQGAFTLSQNTDPTSNKIFPYTLTIPGNSEAWVFSPATIRTTLQSDYVTFLTNLEQAGASPAGIATVQLAISRYMPQTFQETLYYAYGLNLTNRSIDLRPGMVLRVALGDYVTVSDPSISQWMDGYVGGPVVDYEVDSYVSGQNWLAGFDAFIAHLVAGNALSVTAPPVSGTNEGGVADSADFFFQGFTTPFYRLFFPSQLQTPTGEGSVVPGSNFAIAAAASYAALSQSSSNPSSNPVAYFRGRAVARLCIRVTVNGAPLVVPIGTTVGNLLDRYGWRPPTTGVELDGFVLQRSLGPVMLDPGFPFSVGQSYPVRLDWKALAVYGPSQDALTLPLLHGDALTVTG